MVERLGVRHLLNLADIAQEIYVQRLVIDVHFSLAFAVR
jgi:hypothetical protein